MAGDITFTIIKPDAVAQDNIGAILSKISEAGFRIMGMKYLKLRAKQAEAFYNIHKERPFFGSLVELMTSGPIVVAVLEKNNAVKDYRKLIGSINPDEAEEGTIRRLFAESIQNNAVHGSDSDENAIVESNFFFATSERFTKEGICCKS